jgi:hypothetical protein
MKSYRRSFILLAFLISSWNAFSQSDSVKNKYIIDIPLLDAPANFANNSLAFKQFSPSMQQSLGFSKSIAEIQQYYTKYLFFKPNKKYKLHQKLIRGVAFLATDIVIEVILGFTPFGTGWLHEEWHRAVMNKNNVRSFNDMNTFPIGKETVAVSHITDEALANFKATNNSDFVRMGVAGIEAQYEYVKSVQKDNFYNKLNLASSVSYWLNNLNSIQYVRFSSSSQADSLTVKSEKEEGVNIKIRDFTGLDFTPWIYDLSRPNEAYSERGIHPSGVGIRRYRQTSDLTSEELNYLKKMGKMQWLNVISPTMFFINSIKVNNDLRFNFAMFHYLTSFGYDAGSNFFVDYKDNKVFFALHNYRNLNNSFYGVEVQLVDKVLPLVKHKIFITPSLHLWTQPKNQQFRTSESQFGGKVEVSVSTMLGKIWQPYISASAKTQGWVAGDVFLTDNVSCRFGFRALIR